MKDKSETIQERKERWAEQARRRAERRKSAPGYHPPETIQEKKVRWGDSAARRKSRKALVPGG